MKSARNQLILLGFICQGLSWDDFFAPLAGAALWFLCLSRLEGRVHVNSITEGLLLILGSLGSLGAGWLTGHDIHFFIGNGLTLIQAARLLRPLSRREKIFSILIACFQLGVVSTFLFDLRFIPLFLCMAWLLPKSFMELEVEQFGVLPAPGKKTYATILAIAVLFFMAFPRVFMGSTLPSSRAGSPESGTLLDSVVDMTRGGGAESRRVLLQIQGEKIGYLRCYSLTDFDGARWTTPASGDLRRVFDGLTTTNGLLHRSVKVKQPLYLGHVLPTDGWPRAVRGNFINNIQHNNQDAIQCGSLWNTGNNLYEYWTAQTGDTRPLSEAQRTRLIRHPPQSERLRQWISQVVGGETNSLAAAFRLELFLRTNFTYSLGAPVLKRINPVDEFVFEQKEGHCERFASTLALCLRMQGVPSRVVIGYIPRERGWSGGGISVRFSDAHAWTEGWFEGRGWVSLDATPAATMSDSSFFLRDWYDAVDMSWNIHVVNFDSASQVSLINIPMQGWKRGFAWLKNHRNLLAPAVAAILLTVVAALLLRWKRALRERVSASDAQVIADHYYHQLIKLLAARGFHRESRQTPLEFLDSLPDQPWRREVATVSALFCEIRYGGRELTGERERELREALHRLRSAPG